MERKFSQLTSQGNDDADNNGTSGPMPTIIDVKTKGYIVIPYTQGLCKSIEKIYSKYCIETHFKGNSTIKNLLFSPKDKDPMENKSGAIYWFQCGDLACDEEYIREKLKEHLKEPSPIHKHRFIAGHTTTQDNFQIIGREDHGIARTIKESIYIRVNNPTLNRNIGKLNLHHIWDRVLLNTPGLKVKCICKMLGMPNPHNPTSHSYFIGSVEHDQRIPLSEHVHGTSKNIYKVLNFSSSSDLMKSSCSLDES